MKKMFGVGGLSQALVNFGTHCSRDKGFVASGQRWRLIDQMPEGASTTKALGNKSRDGEL